MRSRLIELSLLSAGLLFGHAAMSADATRIIIHAGHVITDPGKPVLEHQSVVVEDGKITAVVDGFVEGGRVIDLSQAWVMPGLIDMHTHVTMTMDIDSATPIADFMPGYLGRPAARVLASAGRAHAVLHGGFTTIRNLGDPASVTYDLRDAINAGVIDGPRIIASEAQFGVPGGDYDAYNFGEREDLEPLFKSRGTCSGATDCERAVREEIRRGAGVIKMRLSAQPIIDPKSGPMETPAELNAIVSTAHRLNRRVATHSSGSPAANQMAIEAGTDTIEHGPLSDMNIATMVKRGTAYVPTLLTAKLATANQKLGVPIEYYRQAVASVSKAYKAHVPILFGTDLPVTPIAREWEEFLALQEAGLTSADSLKSATVNAATALGMADTVGSIEAGKDADVIAVSHDPRADLHEMGKVIFVMKGGKTIRDDLRGS
ncbi:MAG TPA: amidohydrolase family protein [Steroidobacteraceae bacterium]|jgi:imidazolonepropionase-like amidohydrolase